MLQDHREGSFLGVGNATYSQMTGFPAKLAPEADGFSMPFPSCGRGRLARAQAYSEEVNRGRKDGADVHSFPKV